MSLVFLSPEAGLLVLLGALPLAAWFFSEQRVRRVRAALSLPEPSRRFGLGIPVAIVAISGLIAAAATQPVLERSRSVDARTDAEAIFVLDISRSMLARDADGKPSRLARAKRAGTKLRQAIPEVPAGVASFTDRTLPHLFPTADADAFAATLTRAVDIERPPPSTTYNTRSTNFAALAPVAGQGFFSPKAKRRVVVVLTDGESAEVPIQYLIEEFSRPPRVRPIFVQFWGQGERVFLPNGEIEKSYRPDPTSERLLDLLAGALGGRVFSEAELADAGSSLQEMVGRGRAVEIAKTKRPLPLAPYAALAAFLPLGLILVRRNL